MERTALLFAGQGAQTVGMGRELAQRFPSAARLVDEAHSALGYDLASICFTGPEADLTKTEHAQPGIFLVSWMAFQLLRERCPGFAFQAAAGLSLGEFTALAAAGAISFQSALRVVRLRGEAMQEACEATHGTMAAILGLDEATARGVCEEAGVSLANLNCPGQIVISGAKEHMAQACDLALARGAKRAMPLNVAGAYHSPLMSSSQPKLRAALDAASLTGTALPVISNVTAQPHGSVPELRQRLIDQVTAPVRWEDSIRYLLGEGFTTFIELGPGTTLSGFLKRIDKSVRILNVGDLMSLESTSAALGGA